VSHSPPPLARTPPSLTRARVRRPLYASKVMPPEDSLPADLVSEVSSLVVPGSGSVVRRMFVAVVGEWSRNRSAALAAAERTSGLSRDDLAERIEAHPELVPLVTRLLWEAAMTGQHALLEAMGAAFGARVDDLPRAADYELVLGGLRNLRGEDMATVRKLAQASMFHHSEEDAAKKVDPHDLHKFAARLGVSPEVVVFSLSRLTGPGFAVSRTSLFGNAQYELTDLGRLLFDALERLNGGDLAPVPECGVSHFSARELPELTVC